MSLAVPVDWPQPFRSEIGALQGLPGAEGVGLDRIGDK
jgi:hypothetical protein